ncbi:MAG: threonine--tRNA ligase [Candidatus Nanoarchaeia archaeon]
MKLLSLHCDYIRFKAKKKALKSVKEVDKKQIEVKEPLVLFIAVEKQDENNEKKALQLLLENIDDLMNKTNANKLVLYPYAHLSSNLASPDFSSKLLDKAANALSVRTYQAPFGYYKEFELKCKGHPLAELSREISVEQGEETINKNERKNLLYQVSKSKLDTSKLKENDHRIIGKKMDLFSFNDTAPGMVFWHNNGLIIRNELIKYWREEHRKAGYEEILTPQILDKKLWLISGHWEKYKDNIFITEYENRDFAVKPMNCPGGMLVYKNKQKSYKDLPLRVGEIGIVHRQELSGVLSGLLRAIQFTQDDAHIFCTEKQLKSEIKAIIQLIQQFYKKFKLEFDHVELSTRPEKRIGTDKQWDKAEKALEDVLKQEKIDYKINKGDGAFYGPKIDFHIKDSLNRTWQLSTIQLDFATPERFELAYTDKDNKKKQPVMLHRVIYGAIERFLAVLLESTNGKLPTWLSPIQARVISFTDRNKQACEAFLKQLQEAGIRADIDIEAGRVNEKVRNAEISRIPYIITIGDKEEQAGTIAVRHAGKNQFDIAPNKFIQDLKEEIDNRE